MAISPDQIEAVVSAIACEIANEPGDYIQDLVLPRLFNEGVAPPVSGKIHKPAAGAFLARNTQADLHAPGAVVPTSKGVDLDVVSLRQALGFDGSEVVQSSPISGGGWRRAKHPCRWLLVPTRPLEAQTLSQEVIGSGGLLVGGGSTSVLVSSHKTWSFSGWIDGPHDTLGGDLTFHFLDGLARHVAPGGRLRLYQNWGESRHASRTYKGHAYGLERTVEMEGYRGFIQGCLSPSSEAQWAIEWPERIRRRSPVRFAMTEEEV